jgi:PAS domain S-box-containing protein
MVSGYEFTPSVWPILASVAFLLVLAVLLWRHREVNGAVPLAILALLVALMCAGIAAETAATGEDSRRLWFLARDALILPSGILILWFSLEYASLERYLTRPVIAALVGSVLLHFVLYLPEGGRLLWSRVWVDGEVRGELAPLGVAFTAYAFAVFVIATVILLVLFVRSPAHRAPVALILTAHVAVRVVYPLAVLKIVELPNAANVLVLDFAALMYATALLRFRLFDLVPVARQTIIERMPDAMLVLDARGRIADLNNAARHVLGPPDRGFLGTPIRDALRAHPGLVAALDDLSEQPLEVALETNDGHRIAQVTLTELTDWQGASIGRLVLIHDITELRAADDRLLEQERALTAARERERLARDLHDSLGQVLGYLGLQAATIRKLASDGRLDDVDERLGRMATIAGNAQSDVRRTIAELASSSGQDGDFLAALRARLGASRRDYGIETSLAIAPSVEGTHVQPAAAAHLLRIVDEAITNAIRHGEAREARVSLERDDSFLSLSIEDDGAGFETAAALASGDGRYGLRFMRERAAELGGELELASVLGRGTRVMVRVPVDMDRGVVAR